MSENYFEDDCSVSFGAGAFVPCPHCGQPIDAPDAGFGSDAEAMTWALERCQCRKAREWREAGSPALLSDNPCMAGKMLEAGHCGFFPENECSGVLCSAWHPELYAPDLYSNAFVLYGENRIREENERAFKPTAEMIAYILTLPAPEPVYQRKTYHTGACRYCGQNHLLTGAYNTQEQADYCATELCNCAMGKHERRRMQERDIIGDMFVEFPEKTIDFLLTVAEMVRAGQLSGGTTIKVDDNISAKYKMKDGAVIVTRCEKLERQHSI